MSQLEKSQRYALVVAHDSKFGIGKTAALPWKIAEDMEVFRKLTITTDQPEIENLVVMGRKTWQSIPAERRPLWGRTNLVLTHDLSLVVPSPTLLCHDFNQLNYQLQAVPFETCFVIGGASIYDWALADKRFKTIHLTEIVGDFNCDVFFPAYKNTFSLVDQSKMRKENGYTYRFAIYQRNE